MLAIGRYRLDVLIPSVSIARSDGERIAQRTAYRGPALADGGIR